MHFLAHLRQLTRKVKNDDVMPWAALLTLYLLLSLFPLIIVMTDILARVTINDSEILKYLVAYLPTPVYDTLKLIVGDIIANHTNALIPTALVIAIWSASRGMMAIIKALNKAYDIKETRHYIQLRFLALVYTIGLILTILLSLGLVVFGSYLFNLLTNTLQIPAFITPLFTVLRLVIQLLFSCFFFVALYNLSPTISLGFYKVLPGAITTSLGILAISSLFSIYVRYFSNLSYLYGSLTGIIILILWLFLVSMVIMIGGEINAVFSKKKLFDAK